MKQRRTILPADSSPEFRWLMWTSVKTRIHLSMATVGSGQDILLSTLKQMPDLLLLDAALPDISGFTVLEHLNRRGIILPKTIFLSSVVSEQAAARAYALGAVRFIPKPFHIEMLYRTIDGLFLGHPQYPPLAVRPTPYRSSTGNYAFPVALRFFYSFTDWKIPTVTYSGHSFYESLA